MPVKINIVTALSLLVVGLSCGCLSARYVDKTGATIEVHSFLRKAALSDLEIKVGSGVIKIGSLKGQGDAQTLAELRGLLGDLQAAAAKSAVPAP